MLRILDSIFKSDGAHFIKLVKAGFGVTRFTIAIPNRWLDHAYSTLLLLMGQIENFSFHV
jgi:hypothetical protein